MRRRKPDTCPDGRVDCFAYSRSGICKACVETDFIGDCPFYKSGLDRKRGHLAAVTRLEELGRYDLIKKYGETPDQSKVWDEI